MQLNTPEDICIRL